MAHVPAGNLSEIQNLGLCSRTAESESAFLTFLTRSPGDSAPVNW